MSNSETPKNTIERIVQLMGQESHHFSVCETLRNHRNMTRDEIVIRLFGSVTKKTVQQTNKILKDLQNAGVVYYQDQIHRRRLHRIVHWNDEHENNKEIHTAMSKVRRSRGSTTGALIRRQRELDEGEVALWTALSMQLSEYPEYELVDVEEDQPPEPTPLSS